MSGFAVDTSSNPLSQGIPISKEQPGSSYDKMTPLQSAQGFQDISEEEKETDRENLPEIDINQSGQIEHSSSKGDGPSMSAQSGQ